MLPLTKKDENRIIPNPSTVETRKEEKKKKTRAQCCAKVSQTKVGCHD